MIDTSAPPDPKLVQVTCVPPILDEVVKMALRELPHVRVVPGDTTSADIVVASIGDEDPETAPMVEEGTGLILFDLDSNLMGIREPGHALELRPGNLDTVVDVIRAWTERP